MSSDRLRNFFKCLFHGGKVIDLFLQRACLFLKLRDHLFPGQMPEEEDADEKVEDAGLKRPQRTIL